MNLNSSRPPAVTLSATPAPDKGRVKTGHLKAQNDSIVSFPDSAAARYLAGVLLLLIALPLFGGNLAVDSSSTNSVTFLASATMNNFTGKTERISGGLDWEGNALPFSDSGFTANIMLMVDLASIDTGIGRRNRHMREKYLETGRFPRAVFAGKIESWTRQDDSTFAVIVAGLLSIHGVAHAVSVPARVARQAGSYRVFLEFLLNVEDFGIKQPRFLFVKMNTEIQLRLDFSLRSAS